MRRRLSRRLLRCVFFETSIRAEELLPAGVLSLARRTRGTGVYVGPTWRWRSARMGYPLTFSWSTRRDRERRNVGV